MSTSVVIVKKTGVLQDRVIKLLDKSIDESTLYKEAGFKNSEGFQLQTTWNAADIAKPFSVSLYAKSKGKAGQENKYDFPPPVDNTLYFGSCLLMANGASLTTKEWIKIYEHLFGGFEDLGSEDSEESEDELSDPDVSRTKEGYVKDDFIVDDDDESAEVDGSDSDSSFEVKKKPKPKPKRKTSVSTISSKEKTQQSKKKTEKTVKKEKEPKNEVLSNSPKEKESSSSSTYLECSSELQEEAYFE